MKQTKRLFYSPSILFFTMYGVLHVFFSFLIFSFFFFLFLCFGCLLMKERKKNNEIETTTVVFNQGGFFR